MSIIAHYELQIPIKQLYNITGQDLNAYTKSGDIVALPNTTEWAEQGFCIVNENDPRKGAYILTTQQVGVGRGGAIVAMLFSSVDPRIRVYPRGE